MEEKDKRWAERKGGVGYRGEGPMVQVLGSAPGGAAAYQSGTIAGGPEGDCFADGSATTCLRVSNLSHRILAYPVHPLLLFCRALAAPAVLLMTVGQGVFRGIQNMRVPLGITVVTNLIHLALDPLLIFNLHMGLRGAAISTTVSEWLAAGCYCALVWQQRQVLGLWPPPRVDWAQAKERYLPFCQVRSWVGRNRGKNGRGGAE